MKKILIAILFLLGFQQVQSQSARLTEAMQKMVEAEKAGKMDEALKWGEEVGSIMKDEFGKDSQQYSLFVVQLSNVFQQLGMMEKFVQYRESGLPGIAKHTGVDSKNYGANLLSLGVAYEEKLKNIPKALKYYKLAHKNFQHHMSKTDLTYVGLVGMITKHSEMLGKYEDAEKFYHESIALSTGLHGANSRQTLILQGNLANLYDKMQKDAQALALALKVEKAIKKID